MSGKGILNQTLYNVRFASRFFDFLCYYVLVSADGEIVPLKSENSQARRRLSVLGDKLAEGVDAVNLDDAPAEVQITMLSLQFL